MIESIHLAGEGSYDAAGTSLSGLKKLNFIFGPNGSGKTTISRVIEDVSGHPTCSITWASGVPMEARVYNRDFVTHHFDGDSNIKGIYTFGENVEVAAAIETLRVSANELTAAIVNLRKTLYGPDGESGKKKELDDLDAKIVEDIWKVKIRFDDLNQAFSGLNNNKKNFYARYAREVEQNTSEIRDIEALRADAATVYSESLTEVTTLPNPDISKINGLETAPILVKKVIGKEDVDIAQLIERLGNSDWVQQGRQYFEALNDQCPFCQQRTDATFRESLESYFDESYVADLNAIEALQADYELEANRLLASYRALPDASFGFLDAETYRKDLALLQNVLEANVSAIQGKKKEPSAPAKLQASGPLLATLDAHIRAANTRIAENNETVRSLDERRKELSGQIWKRLIEDTSETFQQYKRARQGLSAAIMSLTGQIDTRQAELTEKTREIEENERKITSIKPTIDEVNQLLRSFGFTNFNLAPSEKDGFYVVERADGSDAKSTLSEGEKSFITFLYFYHHIRGSFSASGSTANKIIVFDDPVSSLDSDILFIVCNLIKGVINEMRSGVGSVRQIIILTHNIYFHKEITFDKNRRGPGARSDETFWVIRKSANRSVLIPYPVNPIKSSYELLWREVRQKPPSDTTIQDVMRRILEHYFKFFGGVAPEKIIEGFTGRDRIICASLLSWINDGSHFANDDLYVSCEPGQVDRYLSVFRRIFEGSGHDSHYRMMMGDDYVELSAAAVAEAIPEREAANDSPANSALGQPLGSTGTQRSAE